MSPVAGDESRQIPLGRRGEVPVSRVLCLSRKKMPRPVPPDIRRDPLRYWPDNFRRATYGINDCKYKAAVSETTLVQASSAAIPTWHPSVPSRRLSACTGD